MSIAHALSIADAVRDRLTHGPSDPRNFANTPEEIRAGRIAKRQAEEILSSTITTVKNTLGLIKASAPKPPARSTQIPKPTTLKAHRAAQLASRSFAVADDPASDAQAVVDEMKATNMQAGSQSLQDMATAIGPIVDTFDSILTKPYLDQYSATLNTVPVVGIKNNQLLYIQTKSQDLGLVDVWSTFSSLPPNATINPGDVVHIFPYKGDFCLSIGKTVWKKVHLNSQDPAITNAVDNWPSLYSTDWTALGDCLPSANFAGVVPFAALSADRDQIKFQLVTLAVDGTISWMTSDQLTPQSAWQVMKYTPASGGPAVSPKFTKIAYWNNTVVGIDDASNTWNINVSFQNGTYNVTDQTPIVPVTDFTATDAGPVGVRDDGYLWKRVMTQSPDGDGSKDPVISWERWISVDGVVNIGVASPGVILDMNLLTRTLKSRYIDVQTAVYPVVEKINAFCTTHEVFLNNTAQAAQDYANADTNAKKALAISNAKSFIAHAKVWGGLIYTSVNTCQPEVAIMTNQLHDVRLQLEAQLQILHDTLKRLQATLKSQEQTLSKLQAAFWGSIAAAFIGLAVIVAGLLTGNWWVVVGGGLLVVGGIVGFSVIGAKISDLAGDIAQTKSQIETVNTAITEMTSIVDSFTKLDGLYETLNQFWGRMSNDASNVKTMDDVTAELIGAEILEDTSSIQASLQVTQEMGGACQTYLDTLNKQGIIIPTEANLINTVSVFTKLARSSPAPKLLKTAAATTAAATHSSALPPSGHSLTPVFKIAQTALRAGKVEDYHHIMEYANLLHLNAAADQLVATATVGLWYDLPALGGASNVWMSSSGNFVRNAGVISASATLGGLASQITTTANSLDAALDQARPLIVQALQSILGLGNVMVTWSTQFPTAPTSPSDIAKLNSYKDQAVKVCESAQSLAASANNSFDDFNHNATAYQQNLDAQIATTNNQITSENAKFEQELNDVGSPPWYVILGGPVTIAAWTESQKSNIRSQRDAAINDLNKLIQSLVNLESSGKAFNGHVLTWIETVQTISGNLGSIHNTLVGVWGQLLEDPVMYSNFMQGEWAQLVQNTNSVLAILTNSNTPVALWAVPKQTAISTSLKVHPAPRAIHSGAAPIPTPSQLVVAAISPNKKLDDDLAAQATQATRFFAELDDLLASPYMKDIIGYWSFKKQEKNTLYDITVALRSDYISILASEYTAIEILQNLAVLQEFRATNAALGKLPAKSFVSVTLASVRDALKYTTATNDKFKDSAKDFDAILRVINSNISNIEQKICDLDEKLDKADKADRERTISIAADAIAQTFSSAALLTSFGVIGPAAAALDFAVRAGTGVAFVSAAVKAVLDSLSPSDLVKVVHSLKATRKALQDGVNRFKEIQPLFSAVVLSVSTLNGTVQSMHDALVNVQTNVDLGRGVGAVKDVGYTKEDERSVQAAWRKVRDDAQIWLDVVNKQGIVP